MMTYKKNDEVFTHLIHKLHVTIHDRGSSAGHTISPRALYIPNDIISSASLVFPSTLSTVAAICEGVKPASDT